MIDTQVHILDPARFPYREQSLGYRPSPDEAGTVEDLLKVMDAHGVSRAVLVQASVYGFDNAAMLNALSHAPDRFRAVVMAPNDPDAVGRLAQTDGVCGVRLNLTDFAGHGDQRSVLDTARTIFEAGLCLQIQADPDRLVATLNELGDGSVIIDHLGRPNLASGTQDIEKIVSLAERPQTWLKVSGGFRLNAAGDWRQRTQALLPLTNAFGADRLIRGSDWPFINVKGERPRYQETLDWARGLIADPAASQRSAARLFGWEA